MLKCDAGRLIVARTIASLALVVLQWLAGGTGRICLAAGVDANAVAGPADEAKPAQGDEFTVTGRVSDRDGHPITVATVEWGSDKTPFKRRQQVKTNRDGVYTLVLKSLDRENHLAASAPGYTTEMAESQFSRGRQVRDFTLRPMATNERVAAGVVVDEQGRPIPGVRVEAFTPAQGFISSFSMPTGRDYFAGPDRVTTTDADGRFRIADLPTDKVQLNLEAKHRHVNDENYPVKQELKIAMSGSGQPGVIQGRIIDARADLPPRSTDVRIVPRYSAKVYECGDDGRFHLPTEVTLGGKYTIYVYAKGFAAKECRLTAVRPGSDDFKKIELTIGEQLRGNLIDAETGQTVKEAAVMYGIAEGHSYVEWSDLQKYADGYHPLKFVQHVTTNKEGEFWFAEPEGNSRGMIIVFVPGYQRLILKPDARELDGAGELVLRLKRESAFAGVVLQSGKPVANVSLGVSIPSTGDPMQMPESVHTDAQGRYRYGRLTPGRYYIHGGAYTRIATVRDGETATVNLGADLGEIRIRGLAVPNSSINAHPEFEWDYTNLSTKANDAGEYELRGLKPGKYRISMDSGFQGGFRGRRADVVVDVDRDGQEIDLRSK